MIRKICLVIATTLSLCAAPHNKHVIGEHGAAPGFFSMFFCTMNHLIFCKKFNFIPVVQWSTESNPYCEPAGFHGAKNVWEYYFEPVSSEKYADGDFVWHLWAAPDGKGVPIDSRSLSPESRHYIKNEIIDRYIRIKSHVAHDMQTFYDKHMADKATIGVHIRGTDKNIEIDPIELNRFIERMRFFDGPDIQFFVATDEQKILVQLQEIFPGKVIAYPSFRSFDGRAIHAFPNGYNKAQMGKEALIEVLLLSRCIALIHTLSNFSFAALMFNPELKSVLLL